jgi:hypothetical protein
VSDKEHGGMWSWKTVKPIILEASDLRKRVHELESENARLRELVEMAEEAVELERSIFSHPADGTTVVLRDGWTGKPIVGKVFDFSCFATRAEDAKYATYIDGWTGAEMEPVR